MILSLTKYLALALQKNPTDIFVPEANLEHSINKMASKTDQLRCSTGQLIRNKALDTGRLGQITSVVALNRC